MIKKILAAAAIGAAAMAAQATPANLVSNGALDSSYTGGSYTYNGVPASVATNYCCGVPTTPGTVSGWDGSFVSIASGSGPWNTPSSLAHFDAATQGGFVAGIQADGVLEQTFTNLAAGSYLLSWVDANRGADQHYAVSFTGDSVDYFGSTAFSTTNSAGWKVEQLVFTTTGGAGVLSFTGGTIFGQSDSTSLIDNVQLSAVPEPASLLMMSLATLGLLAWRRRSQL
jgi:hypothetical protein